MSLNIHREIRDVISHDNEISGNVIFFKRVPKKATVLQLNYKKFPKVLKYLDSVPTYLKTSK